MGRAPLPANVDLNVNETVGRRDVRTVFVPVNNMSPWWVMILNANCARYSAKLAALENREQTGEVVAEVKKVRKAVESERRKLAKFVAVQQMPVASPSQEDLKRGTGLLPERRKRQERTFPVIVPERAFFAFLWLEAEPRDHLDALRRLCDRVTRLGHSSSFVRCAIIERSLEPNLVPQEGGANVLQRARLRRSSVEADRLERAYARHQAVEARVLPARPQRYGAPVNGGSELPRTVFTDHWIVFERVGGHRPLASRGSDLAIALRRALIEIHGNEVLPTMLSGHDATGDTDRIQPHRCVRAATSLGWPRRLRRRLGSGALARPAALNSVHGSRAPPASDRQMGSRARRC